MKYRMTKRLLAALLCACLLVTSLPLQALAAVDVTKGNSAQENAQLLQQLEALTGGESEAAAALATMEDLGLVDENGNLLQTRTVTLDGQEMTLDQVRDYLETCKEEDLDKMVEVDGTQVTLENLATMMAIEAEIDCVRETYFSGETPDLTEEQQAALESLANQLETQGITLYNPDALTFPSGVDHGARVSVQLSGTGVTANTDGSVTVPNSAATLTATFSLAAAAKTDVTFQVRTLDGSAVKGTNYTVVEKTVTIPTGQTSTTVEIPVLQESNSWTNDNLWSGDKVFYLQANNITGALFAGDTHSLTQAGRISEDSLPAAESPSGYFTSELASGMSMPISITDEGAYSTGNYYILFDLDNSIVMPMASPTTSPSPPRTTPPANPTPVGPKSRSSPRPRWWSWPGPAPCTSPMKWTPSPSLGALQTSTATARSSAWSSPTIPQVRCRALMSTLKTKAAPSP